MALAKIAVIFLMMIISLFGVSMAMAAVYNVGDAAGWTIMGGVDYRKWADHKDFHVGDTLVFKYSNQYHNVKQVSQKDFLSCNATSPIAIYATGSDSITLKSTGHYYFLCGFPGHCEAGQKFQILVTPTSLRRTPRWNGLDCSGVERSLSGLCGLLWSCGGAVGCAGCCGLVVLRPYLADLGSTGSGGLVVLRPCLLRPCLCVGIVALFVFGWS
ncbi:hypothetical protein JRO89_XS01G0264700 [Xanthoceras sorbifolium]|uniref:Phytocyanin domain-containing protein n=1 Tax=Xanthoceras sorbifolium TaxID=99658 RepID=A0ABQ8ILS3_9ROSI|nr:hypothetical protein JRO89_XS01G0264700 [Xanthoceras sorbifolium]